MLPSLKKRVSQWNAFVDEVRKMGDASFLTENKGALIKLYGLQPTKDGKFAKYNGPLYTGNVGIGHYIIKRKEGAPLQPGEQALLGA